MADNKTPESNKPVELSDKDTEQAVGGAKTQSQRSRPQGDKH